MLNRRAVLSRSFLTAAACTLNSPWLAATAAAAAPDTGTLSAYRNDAELQAALTRWQQEAMKLQQAPYARGSGPGGAPSLQKEAANSPQPSTSPAPSAARGAASDESITNNQTAGVDEGGIVKQCGEYLVILRRGRLFTVRVGGNALDAVAAIDASGPGTDPSGTWYDELLVSEQTVVVIGYSYARGGTEIGLFDLEGDGHLRYRATYHLRSFDYYSSRNYASRLIGRKLIFYTPSTLQAFTPWSEQQLPGARRWSGEGTPNPFERILPATRIFRTDDEFDPREPLALHTIVSCDLGSAEMRCESTAVLGPVGRVFYVSESSVYVWTHTSQRRISRRTPGLTESDRSAVFRIPLDGSAPTALKTVGVPIDAQSFLEDQGHLHVLLRSQGAGEGMWGAEQTVGGPLALLRVPLQSLGNGRSAAQAQHYRRLPDVAGRALQNRYVGEWLIYGGATAWAVRTQGTDAAVPLRCGHEIERIEALGPKMAVLVGNQGQDLHFSSLRLDRREPTPAGHHVRAGARQSETRTHGFFHRATSDSEGLLGLSMLSTAHGRGAVGPTERGTASVLFMRQREGRFTPLGELKSLPENSTDDACRASCVDWYGNARPIFLGDRIFALLGYELIEARINVGLSRYSEQLAERRRINFAPRRLTAGRFSPFG